MFTLNDINVYIMNWKKVNENSLRLYNAIRPIVTHTTIINCDEHWSLDPTIQHIQLDDSCYYGSQFNTAIKHARDGALLCIIVGDNTCENDFSKIFTSALQAFNKNKIGVYAPHDKRSTNQHVVRPYHGSLKHVTNTDCGFWFIHPTIHAPMKNLDYTISKYGWGIDMIIIKESTRRGLVVVSDYSIETDQLDHTCGYDRTTASMEATALFHAYKNMKKEAIPYFRRRIMYRAP
jgi:hypothetical protein